MSWKFRHYEVGQAPDWEAIAQDYDWYRDMKDVPQDAIWHAEGDVQIHTRMVVEALLDLPEFQALPEEEQHILFASAMLHDVEKRSTTETEIIDAQERIIAPGHAKRGEFTSRSLLYMDEPAPFELREQICKLVRRHGRPLWTIDKDDPHKSAIEVSLEVNTQHLAMLAKADVLGRICEDQDDLLLKIEIFEEVCREANCWGNERQFASDYGRYLYLNRDEIAPDYAPYDDLKFEVYMMSALPGSGKDFYIQQHLDLPVLSLDDIRREHKIDPTDKKKNGQVIQMGKEKARESMRRRQSFVFNATNVTTVMRGQWISLFTEYGGRVKIIYVEVPYQRLMQQNRNRAYPIPEGTLHKLMQKWEIPGYTEAHEIQFIVEDLEY
ncbi:MAG: AAA family ATPase [Bacteroidota bacterium]